MALRGGLETSGLGSCFWTRAFGHAFRGSFFGFVLFGRPFRGSFFWSCFSWFVLLFVLLVVLFVVRAFGGSYVFLFDALKFLEACVARSEVS